MNKQPVQQKKTNKGFTIVETLVAISILMLAITGPLLIISQALESSYYSRDEITAYYLAQEGVEYIRNVVDNTALDPTKIDTDWLSGLSITDPTADPLSSGPEDGVCVNSGTCINPAGQSAIPYTFNIIHGDTGYQIVKCGVSCAPLTIDTATGGNTVTYGGTGTDDSIFTRTMWVREVDNDQPTKNMREVILHVNVTWKEAGTPHNFQIEEQLFNWKLEKNQ
jgi:type II secretory pathway pseudopilin PulG